MGYSNTTSKESIRSKIRQALAARDEGVFTRIDENIPLYDTDVNLSELFLKNYRAAGGKFFSCTKDNFWEKLDQQLLNISKVLKEQNYCSILNTYSKLTPKFEHEHIPIKTSLELNYDVDLAIVYSNILVANTGSLVFSQKHILYPTVNNLAKIVFVLAFANHIVADMKTALDIQDKLGDYGTSEFVVPTRKESIQEYSKTNPLYALFLIS